MVKATTKITAKNCSDIITEVCMPEAPFDLVYDFERSNDVHLYDSRRRKYYLDCLSFIASAPLGFNHPALNDPEFERKLLKVAKTKPNNAEFHTIEYAEFVQSFKKNLMMDFKYVYFVEGGASGVDNAIKTSFDWYKKRMKWPFHIREPKVLYFEHSYHGRHGYSLSVTNTQNKHTTDLFPRFDWVRILKDVPNEDWKLTDTIRERIDEVFLNDYIACVILEPIQSVGGNYAFNNELVCYLRDKCDAFGSLLIFDEIQTGVGLSGKMWAYQYYDVKPDMVAFGKKTQVCGFMASERLDLIEDHIFKSPSRLSSTWTGSLTDMVRATKYLEIIERDGLIANVDRVGKYLADKLNFLAQHSIIGNVRGPGLVMAFDLPTTKLRNLFADKCFEYGVLLFTCGLLGIRLRPALIFSEENVDELIDKFRLILLNNEFIC